MMGRWWLRLLWVGIACVVGVPATAADDTPTLIIPALNVKSPILPVSLKVFPDETITWDTAQLTTEVGYFEGTSWLGESNTVLGGHSQLTNGAPSIFYHLHRLRVGDKVVVNHVGRNFVYIVAEVFEVHQADLSVLYPTDDEVLTLITCDVDSYRHYQYDRRVVVVAHRLDVSSFANREIVARP